MIKRLISWDLDRTEYDDKECCEKEISVLVDGICVKIYKLFLLKICLSKECKERRNYILKTYYMKNKMFLRYEIVLEKVKGPNSNVSIPR